MAGIGAPRRDSEPDESLTPSQVTLGSRSVHTSAVRAYSAYSSLLLSPVGRNRERNTSLTKAQKCRRQVRASLEPSTDTVVAVDAL